MAAASGRVEPRCYVGAGLWPPPNGFAFLLHFIIIFLVIELLRYNNDLIIMSIHFVLFYINNKIGNAT